MGIGDWDIVEGIVVGFVVKIVVGIEVGIVVEIVVGIVVLSKLSYYKIQITYFSVYIIF